MYDGIIDGASAIEHLEELCAQPTNMERADYMKTEFEKIGLDVTTEVINSYGSDDINVYGSYIGDPTSDKYLIIGAHHDTVSNSPGANDNGSGSVALIELAQAYADNNVNANFVFASYGMEERGLIGSAQHAKGLSKAEKEKIVGMFNLDCIGAGPDLVIVTRDYYANTDPWMNQVIRDTAKDMGIETTDRGISFGASDQASYIKAGVRATFLCRMDGYSIPNIHTPDDTVENNNADELAEVANLAYVSALEMYKNPASEPVDFDSLIIPEEKLDRSEPIWL